MTDNTTNGASAMNNNNQTIMEMVAENQNLIRDLVTSLPSTIASAAAAALRQPPCVPRQQLGGVTINNR